VAETSIQADTETDAHRECSLASLIQLAATRSVTDS